jgi:hypothetical protein
VSSWQLRVAKAAHSKAREVDRGLQASLGMKRLRVASTSIYSFWLRPHHTDCALQ